MTDVKIDLIRIVISPYFAEYLPLFITICGDDFLSVNAEFDFTQKILSIQH